jgi:pyruvate kinase
MADNNGEKKASIKDIKDYFGLTMPQMKNEYTPMSDKDKDDLKTGIGNGTLTY